MSEYARIGEGWVFWRKYGNELRTVDTSLVTPVLNTLGATIIGSKWLEDSNFYRCGVDGKVFVIVFDLPDEVSHVVEVNVVRLEGQQKTEAGKISVQLPCEDVRALQEQLRALLRPSHSAKTA